MQDRFQQQFNQQNQNPQNPPQEEGKVTLEKTKPSTKTKSDDLGDYVDFEEVEKYSKNPFTKSFQGTSSRNVEKCRV